MAKTLLLLLLLLLLLTAIGFSPGAVVIIHVHKYGKKSN
jgi:hypothetical protein